MTVITAGVSVTVTVTLVVEISASVQERNKGEGPCLHAWAFISLARSIAKFSGPIHMKAKSNME